MTEFLKNLIEVKEKCLLDLPYIKVVPKNKKQKKIAEQMEVFINWFQNQPEIKKVIRAGMSRKLKKYVQQVL